jgi:hypothetical protein
LHYGKATTFPKDREQRVMGELLQQTLDSYSEPWKGDHEEVMAKYRAADGMGEVLSFGIFLFERLYRKLQGDDSAKVQQVEPALEAFLNWHCATSHVLAMADGLQSEDYPVQGCEQLKQLREYHAKAGPIIEDLTDAKRAIESVKAGKAISLDSYIAELRNPPDR